MTDSMKDIVDKAESLSSLPCYRVRVRYNVWNSNTGINKRSVDHISNLYIDAGICTAGRIDSWYRKCQQMETAPLGCNAAGDLPHRLGADAGLCLDHPGNATDASAHHYLLRTGSVAWA